MPPVIELDRFGPLVCTMSVSRRWSGPKAAEGRGDSRASFRVRNKCSFRAWSTASTLDAKVATWGECTRTRGHSTSRRPAQLKSRYACLCGVRYCAWLSREYACADRVGVLVFFLCSVLCGKTPPLAVRHVHMSSSADASRSIKVHTKAHEYVDP